MAAQPSILIRKSSAYEGGTREWSNRYHFTGGTPADAGHWSTLAGNVTDAEKLALHSGTTIVGAVGYAAGSDVPVWSTSYSKAGSLSPGTEIHPGPLEVSALLKWTTDQRTSKNHPIYLFTYIRSAIINFNATRETLWSTQKTDLETYGAAWISGFSDGVNTYHRSGPNGAVGLVASANAFVTHRDFPR